MAIDVGNPEERRPDLVAALKTLMQPEWGSFEEKAQAVIAAFEAATNDGPIIVADAAWSPALAQRWREVWFSGACAVTLPNDPTLPLGYSVSLRRLGAGSVTLAAAPGASLLPAVGIIEAQYLSATVTVVVNTGSLTWAAEGAVL